MRDVKPMTLLAAVAAVGVGALVGAGTFALLEDDPSPTVREVTVESSEPAAQPGESSIAQIYERSHEGVVEITASGGETFGGQPQAQGSGFVYDRDGTILTNQHVVDGAQSISVRLSNGKTYSAALVGADSSTDLAVLDIDAPESALDPLRLGNSDNVSVGDDVVAIGSPFGLEGTITSGIVSALHRQMEAPNGFTINDSIQTDAAINHGNSGGPLLDGRGDVIVAVDGRPISTEAELQSAIDAHKPGDSIELTVLRDGDRRTVDVTLGTRPERIG